MKGDLITRRDFFKIAGLGLTGLAFNRWLPNYQGMDGADLVRVATHSVSVYNRPDDKSTILYQRRRDDLVNAYYEEISDKGPGYNPLWFRVWRGYVHSGYLQKVKVSLNPVIEKIPEAGQLGEITVPFSQSMRNLTYNKTWQPLYRLYYQSHHWVKGVEEGPDGEPWYRLHDELSEIEYDVPAAHVRLIPPEEFAPIHPDVPAWKKRIEVSISRQMLTAYEDDKIVLQTKVSTGVPDMRLNPTTTRTDTPTGEYHVFSKMPSKHMGNGELTNDIEAYELPGVPWTTFFVDTGVAVHGTYWHMNFGIQMSRGCVNVPTDIAHWVYCWTTPVAAPETVEQRGYGTVIQVV